MSVLTPSRSLPACSVALLRRQAQAAAAISRIETVLAVRPGRPRGVQIEPIVVMEGVDLYERPGDGAPGSLTSCCCAAVHAV